MQSLDFLMLLLAQFKAESHKYLAVSPQKNRVQIMIIWLSCMDFITLFLSDRLAKRFFMNIMA
jgi:hypothetical protein